jgi:Glycosyl hydrolase family 12
MRLPLFPFTRVRRHRILRFMLAATGVTVPRTRDGMPIQESAITSVLTAWNFVPSPTGKWDIAYDIWFNTTPSTNSCPNGLEIMIWLNQAGGARPAGSQVGVVVINNMTWNVWYGTGGCGPDLSYKAATPVNSVNFDLLPFFKDAISRGYLVGSWYLIDVEAGTEIWTPGSNFQTNSFSVSVQ